MTNEDLKRFYQENEKINEPFDFVRLDGNGKVPSNVLPSYVDDIIEGYYYDSKFYEDKDHTKLITPEKSKIYVDLVNNISYRWSGTQYIPVGVKQYSHTVTFLIDETDADNLQFTFTFVNTRQASYTTQQDLIDELYRLEGTAQFLGTVLFSGDGNYANPLGYFIGNIGSSGDNMNLVVPAYLDSTITISETDYTFSHIIKNSLGSITMTSVIDKVTEL